MNKNTNNLTVEQLMISLGYKCAEMREFLLSVNGKPIDYLDYRHLMRRGKQLNKNLRLIRDRMENKMHDVMLNPDD